ncbi:MAG: CorA family divalent cation transporter [bacterium]
MYTEEHQYHKTKPQQAIIISSSKKIRKIDDICTHYKLDKQIIIETLSDFEVPRLELRKSKAILFLRLPDILTKNHNIIPHTMMLLWDQTTLTLITKQDYEFLVDVQKLFITYKTESSVAIIGTVVHGIVLEYMKEIMKINDKIQEQFIHFKSINDSNILQLLKYDQLNNLFTSALLPLPQIMNQIIEVFKLTEADLDLINDVESHLTSAISVCEATSKLVISIRDSYQTIFTNRLSKKVQLLTGLTIAITIPNILGTLWGMNVKLPLHNNPYAFWIILGLSGSLSTITFLWFLIKKWV